MKKMNRRDAEDAEILEGKERETYPYKKRLLKTVY